MPDRRRRYDDVFKREAYRPAAEGYGRKRSVRRVSVSEDAARRLILEYRTRGGDGPTLGNNNSYGMEVGLDAVRDHVCDGVSAADVVSRYGIPSRSVLKRWCKAFGEGGEEALMPKERG